MTITWSQIIAANGFFVRQPQIISHAPGSNGFMLKNAALFLVVVICVCWERVYVMSGGQLAALWTSV